MPRRETLRALTTASLLLPLAACDAGISVSDDALVVRGIAVVDVRSGTVLDDQTVVIEGNRVVVVAPSREVGPGGSREVDGTGLHMIPGLWDMHTHLFNNNDPDQPANEWAQGMMVAHGVLGVRDMWVRPENVATVEGWNGEVRSGTRIAPLVAEYGTILDGPASPLSADGAAGPDEAREFVRDYAQAGLDFVKTYTELSPASYEAIHDEAATVGMTVLGHVPRQVRASRVAELGARSIEHLDGFWVEWSADEDSLRSVGDYSVYFEAPHALASFDSVKAAGLHAVMAEREVWQVPTLALWAVATIRPIDDVRALPVHEVVPEWERAEWGEMEGWMSFRDSDPEFEAAWSALWELILWNVGEMHRAGVPFLAGTDIGNPFVYPGHSIHDEVQHFVEAGFTPAEALRTATWNPAQYLSATDSLGFVGPGAVASLVLLGGNPLVDVAHLRDVRGVILEGRYLDDQELAAIR